LPVPELALITLDASFGRSEKDPEIQDILQASTGVNVGLRYLESALNFDPIAAAELISAELAARIVWLDAFVLNVDRTAHNPNMMIHQGKLWLIDHGAAFYVHHNWPSATKERMQRPFPLIAQHVLLPHASSILDVDQDMSARIARSIDAVVDRLPDELLTDAPALRPAAFASAEENRQAYRDALRTRLQAPRAFVDVAENARQGARNE